MPSYPIYHLKCQVCKYEWDPTRRDLPRTCPSCHSDKWSSGYWMHPKLDLSIKGRVAPVTPVLDIKSPNKDKKWGR